LDSVEETLGWPLRQPGWLWKSAVMGLLSFVPVLGWIAAYGWMLATLDRLRSDRRELAPVGLYLGRGWRLFLVLALYSALVAAVAGLVSLVGYLVASAFRETALALLGVLLVLAGMSLGVLGILVVTAVGLPAVVVALERGGIGAALRVSALARNVRARRQASIIAALLLLVAYALGSVGTVLCGVGVVLTTGYSLPVMAAVLRGYERDARL
jgi:hypothetical protein